jgi:phosphoglycolate phosphatase
MLEELLTEMNCCLDEAVMVGDTEFDMEMAARLGMRRIAVSYGAHSPERLARQQPEAIIDSMPTLLDLLNN